MNRTEFVTAREAASILERDYSHVRWLVRKGVLVEIEESPRKRWYRRDAVEALAKARRELFEKAAA
ncbi:MAG: hypothetical protein K2Z80_22410 [Xanthobacteraceae bacterium]|jgi:hypothetical protein|nr:hypothetical protein [Xanthobacteraceae bacterium]